MNPLVVRSAIVASLGGLIFGFDTAVISGTTDALKEVFHLSDSGLGFTVAIALSGEAVKKSVTPSHVGSADSNSRCSAIQCRSAASVSYGGLSGTAKPCAAG
jgi:hypothetical protein